MAFLSQIIKNTEMLLLSKNWPVTYANGRNAIAYFSKKEVPVPPKRPLTAYMLFCQENRQELLKKNPGLTGPEQIKILAEKWNHLNPESRKPFEITARENTLRYGEEHKKFYENLSAKEKELLANYTAEKRKSRRLLRLKRALQESGVPKPALSAYALFIQSFAKDKSDIKEPKDFIKEAAEKWKSLPPETKKSFEEQAEREKNRFSSEMAKWKERMVKEGNENLLKEFEELKTKGKSLISETIDGPKGKKMIET